MTLIEIIVPYIIKQELVCPGIYGIPVMVAQNCCWVHNDNRIIIMINRFEDCVQKDLQFQR